MVFYEFVWLSMSLYGFPRFVWFSMSLCGFSMGWNGLVWCWLTLFKVMLLELFGFTSQGPFFGPKMVFEA